VQQGLSFLVLPVKTGVIFFFELHFEESCDLDTLDGRLGMVVTMLILD
jgi:hypothetical protein